MRDAETVLAIIRERGKEGHDLEDVYRQLYNPDLYLRAYGRIYRNAGAMTKGITEETVDGMSQRRIEEIINSSEMSDIDGLPCAAPSSQRRTESCARSASQRGRTNCCKK